MREYLNWLGHVFRTLAKSPGILVGLVFGAGVANLRILWRRRGRRVWILSVEDATYLPFVLGALKKLPVDFFDNVMFVPACRKFALTEVQDLLRSAGVPVAFSIENWACAGVVFYDLFTATHQSAVVPMWSSGSRVCMFHGLPAKGGTFVPEQWRFFDGAFLIGPLQEQMFVEFQKKSPRASHLWGKRIGLIKSDELLNGEVDHSLVLQQMKLDPTNSTVLYAPSWEAGASLRTQGLEICERLAGETWNTIVKLHPMSYFPVDHQTATEGLDWSDTLRPLESERFRHAIRADITPLVAACDVLVTDVSSVAFEAMLIDKPVVFIECPEFFSTTVGAMYGVSESDARNLLQFNCGREAGEVVDGIEKLVDAIRTALVHPMNHANDRARVRAELVFNPGRASVAAVDALVELLGTLPAS